jgi:hypothetical protein
MYDLLSAFVDGRRPKTGLWRVSQQSGELRAGTRNWF